MSLRRAFTFFFKEDIKGLQRFSGGKGVSQGFLNFDIIHKKLCLKVLKKLNESCAMVVEVVVVGYYSLNVNILVIL